MTKNNSRAGNARANGKGKGNGKGGVCFSLPKSVVEALDMKAEEEDKTRSGYLRGVLTNLFNESNTGDAAPSKNELRLLVKANGRLKKEVEKIGRRLEKALKPKVQ